MTVRKKGSICIYGVSGVGKTLSVFSAFGKKCYGIQTEPDGFSSVESNLGFMPDQIELVNLKDPYTEAMAQIDKHIRPAMTSGKYAACVLDTGTAFCDRLNTSMLLAGVTDARHRISMIKAKFMNFIDNLLVLPGWFIMLCHESPSRTYADGFVKGSPALEGSKLVQTIPARFSLVMRACWTTDGKTAKRSLTCAADDLDPDWVLKDRYGITYPVQDMDLRPILWRATQPEDKPMPVYKPVDIHRPKGYDSAVAKAKAAAVSNSVDKQPDSGF